MATIDGVLFDIDGTLVDSADAKARAWTEALAEFGYELPFDKVRRQVGKGADQLLPELTEIDADGEAGRRMVLLQDEIFRARYEPSVRPFPRARELVQRLRSGGLRLGVASSARRDELERTLRLLGNLPFDATVSADAVLKSKPHPDVVVHALDELELAPSVTVMIGDTPHDLAAATAAGVPFIAFRSATWKDADFAGAIELYEGPADLLDKWQGSVLAGAARRAAA